MFRPTVRTMGSKLTAPGATSRTFMATARPGMLRSTFTAPARMQAQRLGGLLTKNSQLLQKSGGPMAFRYYSDALAQEETPTPALTVEDMMPVENIRNIAIIGEFCFQYLLFFIRRRRQIRSIQDLYLNFLLI